MRKQRFWYNLWPVLIRATEVKQIFNDDKVYSQFKNCNAKSDGKSTKKY